MIPKKVLVIVLIFLFTVMISGCAAVGSSEPTPTPFPATSTPAPMERIELTDAKMPLTLHEPTRGWTFVVEDPSADYCVVGDSTAYTGIEYRSSVYDNQDTRNLCKPHGHYTGSTEVVSGLKLGWEDDTPFLYIINGEGYNWEMGPLPISK